MADYRRAYAPGGTFFFTVVTGGREPLLCEDAARPLLRDAIEACRKDRPFTPEAMVLLPDHVHAIWTLPDGDGDFSTRWAAIKANFTRAWLTAGGKEQRRTGSRVHARRRGVWQRRFWEHQIADQQDFKALLDYIHYNPVKHGLVTCPHLWPYSTFAKWAERGVYERDWLCVCDGRTARAPTFGELSIEKLERVE